MTSARPERTVLLVVDPYNDFTSRVGKGWPLLREVAADVRMVDNIKRALAEARRRDIPVVYAPHRRYRRRPAATTRFPNPSQYLARRFRFFADGRRGGRFHRDLAPKPGEFIATEHPVSSAFTDTDLNAHLASVEATHLVLCGLLANTCIESTTRAAVDLGYRITVLADATAAWSPEEYDVAVSGSLRAIAHDVVSTASFVGRA